MTIPNATALLAAARRYARAFLRHAHYKARYEALCEQFENEYTENDAIDSAQWQRLARLSGLASRVADQFITTARQLRTAHADLLAAFAAESEEA